MKIINFTQFTKEYLKENYLVVTGDSYDDYTANKIIQKLMLSEGDLMICVRKEDERPVIIVPWEEDLFEFEVIIETSEKGIPRYYIEANGSKIFFSNGLAVTSPEYLASEIARALNTDPNKTLMKFDPQKLYRTFNTKEYNYEEITLKTLPNPSEKIKVGVKKVLNRDLLYIFVVTDELIYQIPLVFYKNTKELSALIAVANKGNVSIKVGNLEDGLKPNISELILEKIDVVVKFLNDQVEEAALDLQPTTPKEKEEVKLFTSLGS